jgi:benzoyl-CoA reductase/2-hydroxyglutaryl-CoA dehydratase subunit BcrC/BadD/HgdB
MSLARRLEYEAAGRVVGPALLAWRRLASSAQRRSPHRHRPGSPFGPPLESTRKLKELMSLHYLKGRYADGALPVAWVTSGFPVELLRALGFFCVYPENHAALCSVVRVVPKLSDAAERVGFSRDLCSYARTDIGSALSRETPVGRLPRPDLLACCTNICQTVLCWYRALASHFGVPLVLVDTPFVYGEAAPHCLAYVREQLGEAAEVAARVARQKGSADALLERLAVVVRRAREGTLLWGECLAAGQARPSPWTAVDGFFHMAPIVALRGSEECNAYYRELRDELDDRVRRGISGIRDEKHRLLWDNLPIWFHVRQLTTTLAERGFNFVCASYTNAWAEAGSRVDPADPLGSMAYAYTHVILNQDLANRAGILERLATDYKVDGAVLHSDRSCKPYSLGQVDLRERLARRLGIKVLLLEADHGDPRQFSPEQGETRLTAFMESFA